MAGPSLEERLSAVEAELDRLKRMLHEDAGPPAEAWWKKLVGVFKDDPEFDEAMRLGREYRESQRPPNDDLP
jgi:hypothetical protein